MRWIVFIVAGLFFVTFFIASLGHLLPAPKQDRFNVILISVDSVRADHMGLYGYSRNTTPNIDAWATGAAVFNNYFSTSYLTPISEASVHTGKYPFTNGVINFESSFSSGTRTLAEILKKNGWQTAAFFSSPEFFINPALKDDFSRGFDMYLYASTTAYYGRGGNPVEKAISWLQKQHDKPFFLWLSVGSAHWPYGQGEPSHFSDASYRGVLSGDAPTIWHDTYGFVYSGSRYSTTTRVVVGEVEAQDIAYVVGRYDDGLVFTDRMIGMLFDYLSKSGLDSNTIVVFQSEHGEGLGERGYIAHYDIYDEQMHVPLIIKAPNLSPTRISALASGIDVLPTLLSLAHLSPPHVDGINLVPFMEGSATPSRTEIFLSRVPLWERLLSVDLQKAPSFFPPEVGATTSAWSQFVAADNVAHYYDTAIRTAEWKLIHRLSREAQQKYSWWGWLTGKSLVVPEYELYNLKDDLGETHNIYDARKNDTDVVELQKKLTAWEERMRQELPGPSEPQEIQPYF